VAWREEQSAWACDAVWSQSVRPGSAAPLNSDACAPSIARRRRRLALGRRQRLLLLGPGRVLRRRSGARPLISLLHKHPDGRLRGTPPAGPLSTPFVPRLLVVPAPRCPQFCAARAAPAARTLPLLLFPATVARSVPRCLPSGLPFAGRNAFDLAASPFFVHPQQT
jgi:hypothetical protein